MFSKESRIQMAKVAREVAQGYAREAFIAKDIETCRARLAEARAEAETVERLTKELALEKLEAWEAQPFGAEEVDVVGRKMCHAYETVGCPPKDWVMTMENTPGKERIARIGRLLVDSGRIAPW